MNRNKTQTQICLSLQTDQSSLSLPLHKCILEAIPVKVITKQEEFSLCPATHLRSQLTVGFIMFHHPHFGRMSRDNKDELTHFLHSFSSENKPKATLSQTPNINKMYPGESVNFTCLVDVASGWEYQWYHNGSQIQVLDTYSIDSIDHSNSGEYYCKAKRGKGQFYTEQSETTSLLVSGKCVTTDSSTTTNLFIFIDMNLLDICIFPKSFNSLQCIWHFWVPFSICFTCHTFITVLKTTNQHRIIQTIFQHRSKYQWALMGMLFQNNSIF